MFYNKCEICGANLDPGERCDCREERELERKRMEKRVEEIHRFLSVEKNGQFRLAV